MKPNWERIAALDFVGRLYSARGFGDSNRRAQAAEAFEWALEQLQGDVIPAAELPAPTPAPKLVALSASRDAKFYAKVDENRYIWHFEYGNRHSGFAVRDSRPVTLQASLYADDTLEVRAYHARENGGRVVVQSWGWSHGAVEFGTVRAAFDWPDVEPGRFKLPEPLKSIELHDLRQSHALTFWAYDNPRDSVHSVSYFARRIRRDPSSGPGFGRIVGQRVAVWVNSNLGWADATGTMALIDFDRESERDDPTFRQVSVKQLHAAGVALPPSNHDLFTTN